MQRRLMSLVERDMAYSERGFDAICLMLYSSRWVARLRKRGEFVGAAFFAQESRLVFEV